MRVIKFRAWDKSNKTYTYVTLGDLICGACTESGDKKLSGNTQIWEEGTGIKDKNGREIYEGDIIEWKKGFSRIVIFKNCAFRTALLRTMQIEKSYNEPIFDDALELCEIIGNINENPELLEEK